MMIMPSRLRVCAVALFLATAFANPGIYPISGELVARGNSESSFNPSGGMSKPLEMAMTNGERMRRGLPLNKPHVRRAERARSRPSAVISASAASPTGACTPRTGVIQATSSVRPNDATRPRLDGYLSRTANVFGEYRFTADRADALTVTINDCDGSPFDLISSNGFNSFPYVGGIRGFSTDGPGLRAGSYNYIYIGGVTQTTPHATPQAVGNSFSTASGVARESESAIWSFAQGSNTALRAQWVNLDGTTPPSTLVYVPSENVFILVGDVAAFEATFENVSPTTLTFQT